MSQYFPTSLRVRAETYLTSMLPHEIAMMHDSVQDDFVMMTRVQFFEKVMEWKQQGYTLPSTHFHSRLINGMEYYFVAVCPNENQDTNISQLADAFDWEVSGLTCILTNKEMLHLVAQYLH